MADGARVDGAAGADCVSLLSLLHWSHWPCRGVGRSGQICLRSVSSGLAQAAGLPACPATLAEEQALWYEISQLWQYGPTGDEYPVYTTLPRFVRGEPASAQLRLTRGIEVLSADRVRIFLEARNDSEDPVDSVVVTDTLSAGFEYRWDSAHLRDPRATGVVRVEGINPYTFALPAELQPGASEVLTYEAIPRSA
jgi:uncharacterized repeat protein (TIGR01451 family)